MQRKEHNRPQTFNASRYRVAIVVARFNRAISNALLRAALAELKRCRVPARSVAVVRVPGSIEIPLALDVLARTKKYDCLVALGAVIRGETPHFHYVSKIASEGVLRVMLDHGIPAGFGVLTTENEAQAKARVGSAAQAVRAALELTRVKNKLS